MADDISISLDEDCVSIYRGDSNLTFLITNPTWVIEDDNNVTVSSNGIEAVRFQYIPLNAMLVVTSETSVLDTDVEFSNVSKLVWDVFVGDVEFLQDSLYEREIND